MNRSFSVEDMGLDGLKIIHPFFVEDERGYFLKSFERDVFSQLGLKNVLYEDFETFSKKDVIRGMHFQLNNPQIKMIRVIKGQILDVVVDIRRKSPTFGQWRSTVLSEESKDIFYVPAGFAHGFRVLSEDALVSYKCVGKYDKETDTGIKWDDEEFDIDWGGDTSKAIVSDKDKNLMTFKEFKEKYAGI